MKIDEFVKALRDGRATDLKEPWRTALSRLTRRQIGELGENIASSFLGDASPSQVEAHMLSVVDRMERDQVATTGTSIRAMATEMSRRCREAPTPKPSTPSNLEVLAMTRAYAYDALMATNDQEMRSAAMDAVPLINLDSFVRVGRTTEFLSADRLEYSDEFGHRWLASGFARLEVGHKLAAALALTDIPNSIDVRAPWDAWSLVVPDGVFGSTIARIWIFGTTPWFAVLRAAAGKAIIAAIGPETYSGGGWGLFASSDFSASSLLFNAKEGPVLASLIRGCCLAISNPNEFRKEHQRVHTYRCDRPGRSGPPNLSQSRFLLSAAVKVDLREHVKSVIRDGGGTSPSVQFLVRGHWRNQPHGPRGQLRRQQWIEPFWKGPEEARVLLRQHQIVGGE